MTIERMRCSLAPSHASSIRRLALYATATVVVAASTCRAAADWFIQDGSLDRDAYAGADVDGPGLCDPAEGKWAASSREGHFVADLEAAAECNTGAASAASAVDHDSLLISGGALTCSISVSASTLVSDPRFGNYAKAWADSSAGFVLHFENSHPGFAYYEVHVTGTLSGGSSLSVGSHVDKVAYREDVQIDATFVLTSGTVPVYSAAAAYAPGSGSVESSCEWTITVAERYTEVGACCWSYGCALEEENYCQYTGGTWLGDGTTCADCSPLKVLCVGINDSGLIRPLRGDLSALRVADAISAWSPDAAVEILTLEYDDDNPNDGFDNWTTIEATIAGISRTVQPGDVFILYICTHGTYELTGDEIEVCAQSVPFTGICQKSTGDEYLKLGADSFVISDDTLREKFEGGHWAQVNKLFIIDSCFAGGFWGSSLFEDTGDFATLPKSAIIAAAPEHSFAYSWPLTGESYLSFALEQALLSLENGVSFAELAQAVVDQENWLLDSFSGMNGFEGIIQSDTVDFSGFYEDSGAADFDIITQAVSGFELDSEACPANLDADNTVGVSDMLTLLSAWGDCADGDNCPADFNNDNTVGVADLLELLSAWGPCE